MKNVAIIGKDSFIGGHLYQYLSEMSYNVIGTTLADLDITKPSAINKFITSRKFDVIILLAGAKNVKELEQNPNFGYKINVEPVKSIVNNLTTERFIYFSSDYVFDGKKGYYKVTDTVCPNTVYGQNKADAEQILQKSGKNYAIIRTAGVLGKNSVFLEWILNTMNTKSDVGMYANYYFTPTCVTFLCEAVEKIINDNGNLYHVVQEERFSKYELACLLKIMLSSSCNISPTQSEQDDKSLVQCDFVKKITSKTFKEYLKDILKMYSDNSTFTQSHEHKKNKNALL